MLNSAPAIPKGASLDNIWGT